MAVMYDAWWVDDPRWGTACRIILSIGNGEDCQAVSMLSLRFLEEERKTVFAPNWSEAAAVSEARPDLYVWEVSDFIARRGDKTNAWFPLYRSELTRLKTR